MKVYIYGGILLFGLISGYKINDYKRDSEVLALKEKLEQQRQDLADRQYQVEMANEENARLIAQHQRDIAEDVADFTGSCELSSEWVRIHNNAAEFPKPASSEVHAADSLPVPDSKALRVVTQNYSLCLDQLNRFDGLQKWVAEQYRD